jgi:uncharacterized protein YndB with AHSA1/START domain
VHHLDARVGRTYRMTFTNFGTGKSHTFGGTYVELTPHERIRVSDRFDDPNLPGEMHLTYTRKPVSCGTELTVVREGLPDVLPPIAATSAGRNRWACSPNSWRRTYRIEPGGPPGRTRLLEGVDGA